MAIESRLEAIATRSKKLLVRLFFSFPRLQYILGDSRLQVLAAFMQFTVSLYPDQATVEVNVQSERYNGPCTPGRPTSISEPFAARCTTLISFWVLPQICFGSSMRQAEFVVDD